MNPEVVVALIVAPLFVLGFAGAGGRILEQSGLSESFGSLRLLPAAVALGFCVYSYLGYVLLWFAPLHFSVILGLVLAGIAAGRPYWNNLLKEVRNLRAGLPGLALLPLAALAGGMLVLVGLSALTPVRDGSALEGYMLTARWIASNGLGYFPHNPRYSLFPLGTEIVFSYSFSFGTPLIAKLLDWFLGIFLAAGLYEFANRYARGLYSFIAALSLLAVKDVLEIWGSGKVDVAAALTFLMGWSLLMVPGALKLRGAVVLAAVLVGASCNQKYTNWLFAAAFPIAVLVMAGARRKGSAAKAAIAAAVIALCVLPHAVRDILLTGNPVAPLATQFIPTSNVYILHEQFIVAPLPSTAEAPGEVRDTRYRLPQWLWPLERLFFDYRSDRLGPFPWILIPGLLATVRMRGRPKELSWLLVLAFVQLTAWIIALGNHWIIPRYVLPIVGLLVVAAVPGLEAICRSRRAVRGLVIAGFAFTVFYSGLWTTRDWRHYWRFVAGLQSEASWQEVFQPGRAYTAYRRVAEALGPDARIMAMASLYNLPLDKLPFASTEREYHEFQRTPDSEKLELLRREGFSYYLFSGRASPPDWCSALRPVDVHEGSYALYEVPPPDSDRAAFPPDSAFDDP